MKSINLFTAILFTFYSFTHLSAAPTTQLSTDQSSVQTTTVKTTEARERKLDPPFGLKSRKMSGDWFGLRPELHDLGVDLDFYWNEHFMSVMKGGRKTDSGKFSSTYDLFLTLDLDKMGLIKNADVLVQARQQWGRSVNPWVGPINLASRTRAGAQQVNDDADYDETMYVDQLWYRHHFFERKVALQIGYLDYQTIVDRNAYANSEDKQFMNEALDNNPLIPTASATGLGAALTIKPCDWYSLILGAGDAQRLPLYKPGFSTTFHDQAWFLGYMEHGLHPKIPTANGPLSGNYRIGMVYDPLPRQVYKHSWQRPEQRGDDVGLYLSFDQMLFRESPDNDQGFGGFFRYAYHHDEVYRYNQFWSGGLAYTGLIPGRDTDTLGLAFAQLVDSDEYREKVNDQSGNETIYELYYAINITPWLVISPDIQYIDNPGGNDADDISHAIVGGLRLRVTF